MMIWILVFALTTLTIVYLWLCARWFGAVLMIPIAWWLIWLAALPANPSHFQWIVSLMIAIIIAGIPIWIRDNRTPRYEVLPPHHY